MVSPPLNILYYRYYKLYVHAARFVAACESLILIYAFAACLVLLQLLGYSYFLPFDILFGILYY